jgi:hypothetical protein
MKNMFFVLGVFLAGFLLLPSFSLGENPQDLPHGEKQQKRHLRLVKVEDGKKTELDTIIKGDNIFVWNGDTLATIEDFQFEMPELPNMDSLTEEIIIQLKDKDFDFETPSAWFRDVPRPPKMPHVFHIEKNPNGNIIDLSDPGIISYKKKSIRNGREKIVIIREEKAENENEETDITWIGSPGEFVIKSPPEIEKRIKVQKNGENEIEIEVEENETENSQENN